MVPLGTKALFALAAVTTIAAIAYGVATNDGSGGAALAFVAAGAALLAVVVLFADPDRAPFVAPGTPLAEQAPVGGRLPAPSPWPLAAAVALAVLTLAAAADAVVLGTAFVLLTVVGLGWAFQHWTEDEAYSAAFGRRVRERFILPIGLPVGVALLVATIAISLSRVFLALPEQGTRAVALAIAVVVLLSAVAIAASERMARTALALLSAFALICVVAAGAVGLAHGERKFEHAKAVTTAVPAPGQRPATPGNTAGATANGTSNATANQAGNSTAGAPGSANGTSSNAAGNGNTNTQTTNPSTPTSAGTGSNPASPSGSGAGSSSPSPSGATP